MGSVLQIKWRCCECHDLTPPPPHTVLYPKRLLGLCSRLLGWQNPELRKINNEPKRQLTLSLTRRRGDNRPMCIMICAESFATSVSEALSFIQGLSHPNCMRDDSVNTSTPAKATVMKSVSVAPAPNTTWKSRCGAQLQFITVWTFLTYKTKGWLRGKISGYWKLQ